MSRNLVVANLAALFAGALIGGLYGDAERGLLIAALLALGWQLRQLLRFEAALRSKHFGSLKYGDNIWSQLYSRFTYQRQRARFYRTRHRDLLREVRKSTNAMPDGAVILNADFEILLSNKAAQALAGLKRKKDRGQRIDNILRDPAFRDYLTGEDFSEAIEIRSPMRADGWLSCRLVPYGVDEMLLLIQDVTERRRLASMRRDFVANASHELRSPLTVVAGYLDTLTDDPEAPDTWKKPIEQMRLQANRMSEIVGELLELSRLETAGAAPRDEIVDVCGLLSTARKAMSGIEGIAVIEVDCRSTAQLHGSSAELESVVMNLLSNAVRHTPADGRITMSWVSSHDAAELSVTDTGAGIEPEYIPRLTERFFRVDPGRAREGGGVGLGLAIVKHILERHDAGLSIESTPGQGSTFTCRFPDSRIVKPDPIPIARSS